MTRVSAFLHLTKANQDYVDHLMDAWSYSARAFAASVSFFVHGLVPDWLQTTGSELVSSLNFDIQKKLTEISKETSNEHVVVSSSSGVSSSEGSSTTGEDN